MLLLSLWSPRHRALDSLPPPTLIFYSKLSLLCSVLDLWVPGENRVSPPYPGPQPQPHHLLSSVCTVIHHCHQSINIITTTCYRLWLQLSIVVHLLSVIIASPLLKFTTCDTYLTCPNSHVLTVLISLTHQVHCQVFVNWLCRIVYFIALYALIFAMFRYPSQIYRWIYFNTIRWWYFIPQSVSIF